MHKRSRQLHGHIVIVATIFFIIASVAFVDAGGRFGSRNVHRNRVGGVTGTSTSGFSGANGGTLRSRGYSTDGQGNVMSGSTATVNGPDGRSGIRASETTRTSDGDIQHNGGMAVSGAYGTAQSSNTFSKTSDGTVSGSRNTNVQSQIGGSYQGETNYSTQTGVTHTSTCTDASGNVVECPSR